MPSPVRAIIGELRALRRDFSPTALHRIARLLSALGRTPPTSARALLDAHHELQFLLAFPKSAAIAKKVTQLLGRTRRAVERLSARQRRLLRDSGLAGSISTHTFMFASVRWLADRAESISLEPDSRQAWERLEPLIRQLLLPAEDDAFDESGLTTRDWVAGSSTQTRGPLHWLLEGARPAVEGTWSTAEPAVSWQLRNSRWSITHNRAPDAPEILRHSFRRPPSHVADLLATPAPRLTRLRGQAALRWLDAARAALLARCREVTPTMYASLADLHLADLGEGTAVLIIGADESHRLALEANYGYVLFASGVPVGYGGVTPLADQANTGINLFDAFRHSEAPWLFVRALHAFHAQFGVHRFVVNPYQFGAGNDEALASGAYWFYDRLGFRATTAGGRALGDEERERIAHQPGHRTTRRLLARLAQDDLVLELPGASMPLFSEEHLVTIGRLVARHLNNIAGAGRDAWLVARGRHWLSLLTGAQRPLRPAEKRGFRLLGPVIDLIGREITGWSDSERNSLWELVRAKGASQEQGFARHAARHARFWSALDRRCRTVR